MPKDLNRKIGEMNYDGLISDTNPAVRVGGGTIRALAAEAVLTRGTIMAKSSGSAGDGMLVPLGITAKADETLTPNAILCDDLEVGTSESINVPVYLAGCFDPGKCAVNTGYTVTEDDKDKLRERGIVFKAVDPSL